MTDVLPERELPRRSGSPGRVPPHNLQAEESLLGAMLLSRDAIAAAVEVVGADDFYKPAHGHVFDAVCSLYATGDPVDPVTVSEELRRAGLIDAIGGPATLVTLQANVPATTSASRYARIVEEHALLRRLIWVAGEMAEKAYSLPDDVTKAVDEAESLVFGVAQRRVTDTTAPIVDLLDQTLDRLEELYERGESITGVPTGFLDLDEILSGLQPSALVVVGARPSMGKALALDTPIPTPDGWTTMGDLVVGARVLDDQGQPCTVTYVTPVQLRRQCFAVEFDDGSVIVADADHQWKVGANRIVTTRQLVEFGVRDDHGRLVWSVPLTYPLDLPEHELPVDPYVLGCWLGAGSECHDVRDQAHFEAEAAAAGLPHRGPEVHHIPDEYLRASAKQRLALLQGLADTAASATNGNGMAELFLTDAGLAHQARELVCSLGHKPGKIRPKSVRLGDGTVGVVWRFCWKPLDPVFRLARKAGRIDIHRPHAQASARMITAISPVASVPVRCITVDSPNHLYLAGESMIPTHNTAFALGVATSAALEAQKPVLLFSLEMSQLEVTQRILCAEARVDATRVRNGRLNEADWAKLHHAVGRLAPAQIFIDDNPNITVMDIRAKARRLKSRVGELGVVIVDYIQLMSGRTNAENRQVEVSEISRNLKILARELETPVIALAQLNRQLETRADKRPMLADLRESGSIEQDADVVLFLYRDEVYNPETPDRGTAEVIVAKHRSGPTGKVRLAWLDHYTKFANMARGV